MLKVFMNSKQDKDLEWTYHRPIDCFEEAIDIFMDLFPTYDYPQFEVKYDYDNDYYYVVR